MRVSRSGLSLPPASPPTLRRGRHGHTGCLGRARPVHSGRLAAPRRGTFVCQSGRIFTTENAEFTEDFRAGGQDCCALAPAIVSTRSVLRSLCVLCVLCGEILCRRPPPAGDDILAEGTRGAFLGGTNMDEQTQQKSDSSGGEDALRELAVRLLSFHYSHLLVGQQVQEPQLLVGQLPPDLPVELPLPEGSRLLGSLAVENPMVAIDTQLAGEDVVTFYRERLTTAGWTVQEQLGPPQGGFVHSSRSDPSMATFFTPDDRFTLTVQTAPAPGGRTTVQL